MTKELFPDYAVDELSIYMEELIRQYDAGDTIFVDSEYRGFFIVHDDSSQVTPTMKRYTGTYVYIRPEYRHTKVLSDFYNKLFEFYPYGDILGSTEICSAHIDVLDKRHKHIMNVYSLNRGK